MIDFEFVSRINDSKELSEYISQLDDTTIYSNKNMLNFINGFIFCKSLYKHNLSEDTINKIFSAHLKSQEIKNIENLYNKS